MTSLWPFGLTGRVVVIVVGSILVLVVGGMALYLHATCNRQNGVVYAVDGSITFDSLFSGDPNELEASERLTEAFFDAEFADPRAIESGASTPSRASERAMIVKALEDNAWNKSKAARALGISRDNLRYRVKKYNIGRGGGMANDE